LSVNKPMKWKFIAGDISLNFTNSVGGRILNNGDPIKYKIIADKLESYTDLIEWGKEIGILNKSDFVAFEPLNLRDDKSSTNIFKRAISLREAIYKIMICIISNLEPRQEDIDLLNSECVNARENQKLIFESNQIIWDIQKETTKPDFILWQLALSAAELLTGGRINRIKNCPGENCGWLFIDKSKNGSRQWCDMKDCGNLAKVRRFRENQNK